MPDQLYSHNLQLKKGIWFGGNPISWQNNERHRKVAVVIEGEDYKRYCWPFLKKIVDDSFEM